MSETPIKPSSLTMLYQPPQLLAVLSPSENSPLLDKSAIEDLLDEQQRSLFFEPDVLDSLVAKIAAGDTGEFLLAEQRDGHFEIEVTNDKSAVYLTTEPAYGGTPLAEDDVLAELDQLAIKPERRFPEAISEAIAGAPVTKRLIAQALAPVNGEDGRLDVLVTLDQSLAPSVDEAGRADLNQLQEFVSVKEAEELMRRVEATLGIPGENVYGGEIKPKAGKKVDFASNLQGTLKDPNDKNLLIAKQAGHPVAVKNGIKVDPVLTLDEVGVKSGNVDFDGSVDIRGDVTVGYVVKATGDIRIQGTVERARILCGGTLSISGGVVGDHLGGESKAPVRDRDRKTSYLQVGGNFNARFASNVELKVHGDVEIREYLLNSQLTAGGEVRLGQSGGKGTIISGHCHSDTGVVAKSIGNHAYDATQVSAGNNELIKATITNYKETRQRREEDADKLEGLLQKIKHSASNQVSADLRDKEKRIANTIVAARKEAGELTDQINELEQQLKEAQPAYINVQAQLFGNVSLEIDGGSYKTRGESPHGYFVHSGGEVVRRNG